MEFEIFIVSILFFLVVYQGFRKGRNMPPGPMRIPIIGSTILLRRKPHEVILKLKKTFGNMCTIYFGSHPTVILQDYETVRDVFIKNGEAFVDRPKLYLLDLISGDGGLVFSNGQLWKDHRRFAISTLRDNGLGKKTLQEPILEEINRAINHIGSKEGQAFNIRELLNMVTSNIISNLAFNTRLDYEDPYFKKQIEFVNEIVSKIHLIMPLNFIPATRIFVPKLKILLNAVHQSRNLFKKIFQDHSNSFDSKHLRDYVDAFLNQMKTDKENKIEDSTFTENQLLLSIESLFDAGSETTSNTLTWGILYLVTYPEIQKRIQIEIDHIVGRARPVTLEDKLKMSFTEAAIIEIQRCGNLVPMSVPRLANTDVDIQGYTIPKGTIVFPNLWALHRDPKYWPEPDRFDPERHLDKAGQIKKVIESFLPFGDGKRICLGESLARMELFLILANFLQHYSFQLPANEPKPNIEEYIDSAVRIPLPYKVQAIQR